MGQVRTHAFLMQIVPPPLINVPWAQKPWIYSKNGISCSKMVPIHSNKSCSPSTNLYARKCFSLPGWLPSFAAQYTRTLVYLLLKKTLVCCEQAHLSDQMLPEMCPAPCLCDPRLHGHERNEKCWLNCALEGLNVSVRASNFEQQHQACWPVKSDSKDAHGGVTDMQINMQIIQSSRCDLSFHPPHCEDSHPPPRLSYWYYSGR